MKKLALAPAIALAITGLAAAPVIAAPAGDVFDSTIITGTPGSTPAPAPTEDEVEAQAAIDAQVSISPEVLSQSDLVDLGVTVTVTGLEPGDVVTDSLTEVPATAVGDTVEFTIFNGTGDPEAVEPGIIDFTVTVERTGETDQVLPAQFEVTSDGGVVEEASLQLSADSISVSELKENGLPFTGEGFAGDIAVAAAGSPESEEAFYVDDNIEVAEDGTISGVITLTETDDIAPGEYVLWASDESGFAEVLFTVTADETEAPAEASLTVSPKKIEAADFVNEKKGVTLAVENCEPGSDVNFRVNPKGINVTAYESTEVAGEDGSASVLVFGTSADAEAYIGDYDVTVTCGDTTLTDAFSVTEGAKSGGNDGGKDDKGNGGDKGELPKTGAELTGLTAGAALLLIGGAAVALTTRRKKVAQSPSEI